MWQTLESISELSPREKMGCGASSDDDDKAQKKRPPPTTHQKLETMRKEELEEVAAWTLRNSGNSMLRLLAAAVYCDLAHELHARPLSAHGSPGPKRVIRRRTHTPPASSPAVSGDTPPVSPAEPTGAAAVIGNRATERRRSSIGKLGTSARTTLPPLMFLLLDGATLNAPRHASDAAIGAAVEQHPCAMFRLNFASTRRLTDRIADTLPPNSLCAVKSIDLTSSSGCSGLTDAGIAKLLNRCPPLRDVRLTNSAAGELTMAALAQSQRIRDAPSDKPRPVGTIETLEFADCSGLTNAILGHFPAIGGAVANNTLRVLDVSRSTAITSTSLPNVVGSARHLTTLRVAHCYTFNDRAVAVVVARCPSLEKLDASGTGVTVTGVAAMVFGADAVVVPEGRTVPTALPTSPAISALPQLQALNLASCALHAPATLYHLTEGPKTTAPSAVTTSPEHIFGLLGATCPHLSVVDFAASELPPEAAKAFGVASGRGRLTEVSLSGCPDLTPAALEAYGGPTLTVLRIDACTLVTAASVLAVTARSPGLQTFCAAHCGPVFDNDTAERIGANCPRLREVDVRFTGVRQRGLFAIVEHCRDHIRAIAVSRVDVAFADQVAKVAPLAALNFRPMTDIAK